MFIPRGTSYVEARIAYSIYHINNHTLSRLHSRPKRGRKNNCGDALVEFTTEISYCRQGRQTIPAIEWVKFAQTFSLLQ